LKILYHDARSEKHQMMTTCFGRAWPSSGHKLIYN